MCICYSFIAWNGCYFGNLVYFTYRVQPRLIKVIRLLNLCTRAIKLDLAAMVPPYLQRCSAIQDCRTREVFLMLRPLFLVLITTCFFGCGGYDDNNPGIPVITLEKLREENEGIWFRLNVTPSPTADLAVLITAENVTAKGEHVYAWIIVPRFSSTKEFSLSLDVSVSWNVGILPLDGIDLNLYSTEGANIPDDFEFRRYTVGDPSEQTTQVKALTALLSVEVLRPMPANGFLIIHFDTYPEELTISHGKAQIYDNTVYVHGDTYNLLPGGEYELEILFPIGEFELETSWAGGRGNEKISLTVIEPDFVHPKVIQTLALTAGIQVEFKDGSPLISPDTDRIEMQFDELVRKDIYAPLDIQTEVGDKLEWEIGPQDSSFGEKSIILHRSNGTPLLPETTYIIKGAAIDLGGNIMWPKITFTTSAN